MPASTSSTISSITARASATLGVVALERQLVPAQADACAEALLERVQDTVGDPGQLGRDPHSRHRAFVPRVQCRLPPWAEVWTLLSVCVATFMLLLDITIVNIALPAIQRSLGASFSDLQWVVDAYALALATCVLTAGSLPISSAVSGCSSCSGSRSSRSPRSRAGSPATPCS